MKKALALLVALMTAAASAQPAPLAPPAGEATGSAPPRASSLEAETVQEFHRRPRLRPLVVVDRVEMEERLAEMEELLGEAFEHGRKGKSRGKIREAHEALNVLRGVLANAPDVRTYLPQPVPQQPVPPPAPAVQPIADAALKRILHAMSREPRSQQKIHVLQDASRSHYFLVSHLQQMLKQFSFSKDRLEVVRGLWPRVLDRENGFELYDSFRFSSDKKALQEIISG